MKARKLGDPSPAPADRDSDRRPGGADRLPVCVALLFGGGELRRRGRGRLGTGVPRRLVPIYMEAAERYRLGVQGPSVLAAINWVETGFGTDLGTSWAGAEGWMQFEPESWASYGVDGDGDGVEDPDDPWDAIFAAARLLHVAGAPADWHGAIWDYNHADWYVEKVLRYARRFAGGAARRDGGTPAPPPRRADEAVAGWLSRPAASAGCGPIPNTCGAARTARARRRRTAPSTARARSATCSRSAASAIRRWTP